MELELRKKKKIFLDAKRKKEPTPPTARKNNYPILLERRKEGGKEGLVFLFSGYGVWLSKGVLIRKYIKIIKNWTFTSIIIIQTMNFLLWLVCLEILYKKRINREWKVGEKQKKRADFSFNCLSFVYAESKKCLNFTYITKCIPRTVPII